MTPEQIAAIQRAQQKQQSALTGARVSAAQSGTLQPSQESLDRHEAANQVALAQMGLPATPTGEAQANIDNVPGAGFQAARSAATPVVGGWSDELAGVAEMFMGGDYEQGRQRFLETARLYSEQNPNAAKWAKRLGGAEGTIAALSVGGASTPLQGSLPARMAQGAGIGAVAAGAEGAVSEAGRAEPGQRAEAAVEGAKTGALFGAAFGAGGVFVADKASKVLRRVFTKTAERPTVEGLRAAKNLAYRAVDEAGETFTATEVGGMVKKFEDTLDASDYVGGMGQKVDIQLARLRKMADKGQPITLSRLDDVRSRLWKAYNAAQDEVEILDAISIIDEMIDAKGGDIMRMAREANARFRKAELLENAFEKAQRQTASTGSGGNILNKYRQAVTGILSNQKQAKFFSQEEIAVMDNFVRGDIGENVLRRIGKLSPNGNGLMQALNLAAVAVDPTAIAGSAAATFAKDAADRSAMRGADSLQDMVATGQAPAAAPTTAAGIPAGAAIYGNQ